MSVLCTACGLEIPIGHDSIYMSHGSIERSKKSGREFHNSHEDDPIHSDIECVLQYLAYRSNSSADQLTDTAVDKFRRLIEPDLRVELSDEIREQFRDEIQEEVVDHLGRHCAVCNEEMDSFHDAMERDNPPRHQQQYYQPQQPQYPGSRIPLPLPNR